MFQSVGLTIVFHAVSLDMRSRDNMKNTLDVASKSGFTCIGIQPNTNPVIDKRSEIEYIKLLSYG